MPHIGRPKRPSLDILLIALAMVLTVGSAIAQDDDLLAQIEGRLIPAEGTLTDYGISLSLESLPQFVDWWYTLVPDVENDPRYVEALSSLVAPCCDDNLAFKCCCEDDEGQACNIIRSAKGLAAHLISEFDYDTQALADSILQWLQFARPDYYVARELENVGENSRSYGLTTKGSCYRGLCNTPISEGGCGGMKELIEPTITGTGS